MRSRLELQDLLEKTAGTDHVYYQPPTNVAMKYPAIRYARDRQVRRSANDGVYSSHYGYSVTVIDRDPDSPIVHAIAALPLCSYDRHYAKDNLNYDVFTIYW